LSSLFEPTLLALAAAVWLMVRVGMVMRPVRATSYRSAAPHVEEGTRRLWPDRLLSVGNGSAASPGAGYRAIAARIAADAHPNAGIILIGPNQMDAFARHHRGAPVYSLPEGQTHPTTLKLQLATITAPHERMYVIYTRRCPPGRPAARHRTLAGCLHIQEFGRARGRYALGRLRSRVQDACRSCVARREVRRAGRRDDHTGRTLPLAGDCASGKYRSRPDGLGK
jgi:hypothetical protein